MLDNPRSIMTTHSVFTCRWIRRWSRRKMASKLVIHCKSFISMAPSSSCLQYRSKVPTEEMVGKEGTCLGCTSPHSASLPGQPHAVIVCVMFEIQLLASTAQFYCAHFGQRKKNDINSVQLQGKKKHIQLIKSTPTGHDHHDSFCDIMWFSSWCWIIWIFVG